VNCSIQTPANLIITLKGNEHIMPSIEPPNINTIKRRSILRFLEEMQDLRTNLEMSFLANFEEKTNSLFSGSKSTYSPQEVNDVLNRIKQVEKELVKQLLTDTSENGTKILRDAINNALTSNVNIDLEVRERILELEHEVETLTKELNEKEQELITERANLEAFSEDQFGDLTALQRVIDEQKTTIANYEKQVMEHGEALAQQRLEIEALQEEIGELTQEKQAIETQLEGTSTSLRKTEKELLKKEKTIVDLKKGMAAIEKSLRKAKQEGSEELDAEKALLEERLKLEQEQRSVLEEQLSELEAKYNALQEVLAEKDEALKVLQEKTSEREELVSPSLIVAKDAQINQLSEEKNSLAEELTAVKKSLAKLEKKVKTLNTNLKKKKDALKKHKTEITKLKKQLAEVQRREATVAAAAETSSMVDEEKLQELLREKEKSKKEIAALQEEIQKLQESLQEKELATEEVARLQAALEEERETLEEERDTMLNQLEDLEREVERVKEESAQKESMMKRLTKSPQKIIFFLIIAPLTIVTTVLLALNFASFTGNAIFISFLVFFGLTFASFFVYMLLDIIRILKLKKQSKTVT